VETSREPPEPIKRLLRQEASFGCCKCGYPFYEYHHIIPYSEIHAHDPDNMMVLCPNHHHQATVGALTSEAQRENKASPFNRQRGYATGPLFVDEPYLAVQLGTNQFVGTGTKLAVDGAPLLLLERGEDGGLLVSLDLYDRADRLLATISRNEWKTGDEPGPWDFEYGHRWVRVRNRPRKVNLFLDARRSPVHIETLLWRKGQSFSARGDRIQVNGAAVKDVTITNVCLVGLSLDVDTAKGALRIVADPEFGEGTLVSWPDPEERVRRGYAAYLKLVAEAEQKKRAGRPADPIS